MYARVYVGGSALSRLHALSGLRFAVLRLRQRFFARKGRGWDTTHHLIVGRVTHTHTNARRVPWNGVKNGAPGEPNRGAVIPAFELNRGKISPGKLTTPARFGIAVSPANDSRVINRSQAKPGSLSCTKIPDLSLPSMLDTPRNNEAIFVWFSTTALRVSLGNLFALTSRLLFSDFLPVVSYDFSFIFRVISQLL